MTAVGTCTEKIGDRIFGFGHPFNDEGPIDLPMGSGSIAAVVANRRDQLQAGFYFGDERHAADGSDGGRRRDRLDRSAPMAPIEFRIVYDDGSVDQTYHFTAAVASEADAADRGGGGMTMALAGEKNLPRISHGGLRSDGGVCRRPDSQYQEQQRERRRNRDRCRHGAAADGRGG